MNRAELRMNELLLDRLENARVQLNVIVADLGEIWLGMKPGPEGSLHKKPRLKRVIDPWVKEHFRPRVRARIAQLEGVAKVCLTSGVRMKLAQWFYGQSPTEGNADEILKRLPHILGNKGSKLYEGYAAWLAKLNVECARQSEKPEAG